jgi:hypothetical protein
MSAAPAPGQQRFNELPLRVAQPIKLRPHLGLPRFGSLESQSTAPESLLSTDRGLTKNLMGSADGEPTSELCPFSSLRHFQTSYGPSSPPRWGRLLGG